MKLIFISGLIIACLFCQTSLKAQQNGFVQVYNSFEKGAIATIISETDEGYTVAGYFDKYFVIKADKMGNPQKITLIDKDMNLSYPTLYFQSPIIKTNDHGLVMIDADSTTYNNRSAGVILIKADSDANILWRKKVDSSASYYRFSLLESRDGNIYIALQKDSTSARLIKTSPEGDFLWSKDFILPVSTQRGIHLGEFSDKKILLAGLRDFFLIDPAGNTIDQRHLQVMGINDLTVTSEDEIIFSNGSYLVKIDISGNVIWNKEIGFVLSGIFETSDGGIFGFLKQYNTKMVKLDSNGNPQWEKDANSFIQFAGQTADGGYIWAGNIVYSNARNVSTYLSLPAAIKTDSEGNYTAAAISFPLKQLRASWEYEIKWLANNVPYIDIDYSTDNGTTWQEAVRSFSTEQNSYNWTAPFRFSDNCLLRLRDSNNPSIQDQSDSVFSIIPPYNTSDRVSVNEVKMWVDNNGIGSHNPYTSGQGFFWPGGEDAVIGAVFQDGLVWGGKVDGETRTGGSTYRSGLQPGNILPDGSPSDSGGPSSQVWRIRKNWQDLQPGVTRDLFEYNYNHWPVGTGIPWLDANSDGVYTPGIDHPVIYGDEMLFNAANDFDIATSRYLYGSDPMGIEMQCITFAKDTSTALKDAVFKKYKLINKGNSTITDMYLSYWTDDDMGDAEDDYIGVETSLNLGYTWNATNDDILYGSPPPSIGHMIIQGPRIAASLNDSARFGDGWIKGYKNLELTAFGANFKNSVLLPHDPVQGEYEGTLELYNLIRGFINDGSSFINPLTNEPTVFPLNGDPATGSGWYEGEGWPGINLPPGDRRFYITSGPFNLAPGDTQEIAVAIFMAKGSNNLQSIAALRDKVPVLRNYYNNELVKELKYTVPVPLTDYYLSQNYPNPFNSTTNINYTIPQKSVVTIKIYDILGREVKTLNQGEQVPWYYTVNFNASALASGVYLYRIEAIPVNGQSGSFVQTKKMVLLK